MMDIVIKAENLGKMYTIGHQTEKLHYVALRDVIMKNARSLWNKTKDLTKGKAIIQGDTLEEVWALKNLSFEIKRGEALGIIGRNGAGKSTLLKVLSRITEPSTGRVTIKGRVASLLEVGTGFHQELTGRENIFLNGAILGMSRAEIKQKFDEIVAFAEVEKYLDTPVKRYSSGMYVRLAFAVAAHLEPEILVVDEVLAVGDAEFQKKCLGKMGDVTTEGRTVLFVSHNLQAISTLCSRCLVLNKGELQKDSDTSTAVSFYLNSSNDISHIFKRQGDLPKKFPRINKAWFEDENGEITTQFDSGKSILLIIETENPDRYPLELNASFYDNQRRPLWLFNHSMYSFPVLPDQPFIRTRLTFSPPYLTVPELRVDLVLAHKGGTLFYDHLVDIMKCFLIRRESTIGLYPKWPIKCNMTMEHFEMKG